MQHGSVKEEIQPCDVCGSETKFDEFGGRLCWCEYAAPEESEYLWFWRCDMGELASPCVVCGSTGGSDVFADRVCCRFEWEKTVCQEAGEAKDEPSFAAILVSRAAKLLSALKSSNRPATFQKLRQFLSTRHPSVKIPISISSFVPALLQVMDANCVQYRSLVCWLVALNMGRSEVLVTQSIRMQAMRSSRRLRSPELNWKSMSLLAQLKWLSDAAYIKLSATTSDIAAELESNNAIYRDTFQSDGILAYNDEALESLADAELNVPRRYIKGLRSLVTVIQISVELGNAGFAQALIMKLGDLNEVGSKWCQQACSASNLDVLVTRCRHIPWEELRSAPRLHFMAHYNTASNRHLHYEFQFLLQPQEISVFRESFLVAARAEISSISQPLLFPMHDFTFRQSFSRKSVLKAYRVSLEVGLNCTVKIDDVEKQLSVWPHADTFSQETLDILSMIFGEEPAFKLDISNPRLLSGSNRALGACKSAAKKCNVHIEHVIEPRAMTACISFNVKRVKVELYGMEASHWSTYQLSVRSTVADFQAELRKQFLSAELLSVDSDFSCNRAGLLKDHQQLIVKVTLKRWWVWPTPWLLQPQQQERGHCNSILWRHHMLEKKKTCDLQEKNIVEMRALAQQWYDRSCIRRRRMEIEASPYLAARFRKEYCAAKAKVQKYEAAIAGLEESGESCMKKEDRQMQISLVILKDKLLAVKRQLPILMEQAMGSAPSETSNESIDYGSDIWDFDAHDDYDTYDDYC